MMDMARQLTTAKEDDSGIVTLFSVADKSVVENFHGATVAGFICMGWDDEKLSRFNAWMRGQGMGVCEDGAPYYFGHDIDRFLKMERD